MQCLLVKDLRLHHSNKISQYHSTVCQNIRMHNKLFLSSKSGERCHIHVVTVKGALAHLFASLNAGTIT